jgi:hypothetical protein
LPHLAGGGADQTAAAEEQHCCCLLKTALSTLQELAVLPDLTTPTNLVDRRSKYHSLTSQSPGETTSEFPLEHQYQEWIPKEQLQNFY